jgi:hypothetical protein
MKTKAKNVIMNLVIIGSAIVALTSGFKVW